MNRLCNTLAYLSADLGLAVVEKQVETDVYVIAVELYSI